MGRASRTPTTAWSPTSRSSNAPSCSSRRRPGVSDEMSGRSVHGARLRGKKIVGESDADGFGLVAYAQFCQDSLDVITGGCMTDAERGRDAPGVETLHDTGQNVSLPKREIVDEAVLLDLPDPGSDRGHGGLGSAELPGQALVAEEESYDDMRVLSCRY